MTPLETLRNELKENAIIRSQADLLTSYTATATVDLCCDKFFPMIRVAEFVLGKEGWQRELETANRLAAHWRKVAYEAAGVSEEEVAAYLASQPPKGDSHE